MMQHPTPNFRRNLGRSRPQATIFLRRFEIGARRTVRMEEFEPAVWPMRRRHRAAIGVDPIESRHIVRIGLTAKIKAVAFAKARKRRRNALAGRVVSGRKNIIDGNVSGLPVPVGQKPQMRVRQLDPIAQMAVRENRRAGHAAREIGATIGPALRGFVRVGRTAGKYAGREKREQSHQFRYGSNPFEYGANAPGNAETSAMTLKA